jgi:predicted amidohydrolase
MPEVKVAAIQMDAQVGAVEANLARAATLVEQAEDRGMQIVVLPEMFSVGYEYTDRVLALSEPLDGPTGTWIVETARRLGIHLLGSFLAQMANGTYIVAMLAAPDDRQWVYRKVHVATWENCYFDRGTEPLIADTELGRIGLIVCWDEIFTDLARAYQGRVDLLCISSSPPTFVGQIEDSNGRGLAPLRVPPVLGPELGAVDLFSRAQERHAQSAGVPLVYAARCGTFHSLLPYGSFYLAAMGLKGLRVLRAVGTRYLIRCPMMGRSCILNAQGERIASTDQNGEAVLTATVQAGAPDPAALPPVPRGRAFVSGTPTWLLWFDDLMTVLGRWYRRHHAPET